MALNAAPDDFRPQRDIFTTMMLTSSKPNLGPAVVHMSSLHFDIREAFCKSHANMSIPFSATIVNAVRTESLETIDECVIDAGGVVVCLPPTSRNFLRKFSPSLMSKIIWHFI